MKKKIYISTSLAFIFIFIFDLCLGINIHFHSQKVNAAVTYYCWDKYTAVGSYIDDAPWVLISTNSIIGGDTGGGETQSLSGHTTSLKRHLYDYKLLI